MVVSMFLGIMAMITPDFQAPLVTYKPQAVALNFAFFRSAAHQYVFAGHKTPGTVPVGSLQLPPGWTMMRAWNAQVAAGYLYIWGVASPDEIAAARNLSWNSYAIGRVSGGVLVPGNGCTTPIPAFVPDGNIVSVIGIGS
ncbi:MAG: type IV pilus biogenesis protein PilM [Desulfovibrionaceae bacterium]|nr:type IV pilus biogenesis protein PilM [Desulfovibrionaceae bacterium]MBF0515097.1 type IV pilus biogenesis protein PilM [Desulfovibrionaceae bacterium]